MNDNLKSALQYAGLGWRVYPVWGVENGKCLCERPASCKPGKHPWGKMVPHGGKDATTDADKLRSWFVGSGVNVGIRVDGFCVLDVENRNGGMELLKAWELQHGKMPLTPTAVSGGGGRHFYFRALAEFAGKEKIPFVSGAELLVGGDVIASPSTHVSGGNYSWITPPETPLAELPEWLTTAIRKASSTAVVGAVAKADEPFDLMKGAIGSGDTFATLGRLHAGNRNDPLNAVIGSMFGNGFTVEQILAAGRKWAQEQEPPYSETDLESKVRFFAGKTDVSITEFETESLESEAKLLPLARSSQFAAFADCEQHNVNCQNDVRSSQVRRFAGSQTSEQPDSQLACSQFAGSQVRR